MNNCPFCNIAGSNRLVNQGPNFLSFLSSPRLMPGHVLWVPRRHITGIDQLSPGEMTSLLREFQRIRQILFDRGLAAGFDLWQHDATFQTQGPTPDGGHKVDHLHIHGLPRQSQDPVFIGQGRSGVLFSPLDNSERITMLGHLAVRAARRP